MLSDTNFLPLLSRGSSNAVRRLGFLNRLMPLNLTARWAANMLVALPIVVTDCVIGHLNVPYDNIMKSGAVGDMSGKSETLVDVISTAAAA